MHQRLSFRISQTLLVLLVLEVSLTFCQYAEKINLEKYNGDAFSATVPIILDHNRMLVNAEIQRKDGGWRKVRLWIDSGSPGFFISEALARDLGIDLSEAENSTSKVTNLNIPSPSGVRIGGMNLNFEGVNSRVMFQPFWLFSTMHIDGNLPSTVLKKYHIVFDYPNLQLTFTHPGKVQPHGIPIPAYVNSTTGIVQIDAVINGDSLSFALDNGASYSFISAEKLTELTGSHPDWKQITGTVGCANMWGWWPANEQSFQVVRIPKIQCGKLTLDETGIVGVPKFSATGQTLGKWYSQKTARHVDGFLGPNVFKNFRVEIDYTNSLVYFEKGSESDAHEMDLVGISVRQLADSSYQIAGIVHKNNKPLVEGVEPGDILVSIGDFKTMGETMGKVVDALRGKPGEVRVLTIERNGKKIILETKVKSCL